MRIALVLLALLFLGGCSTVVIHPEPHIQEATKYTNVLLSDAWLSDKQFHVYVDILEHTDYKYVIQEITLPSGETVVECFGSGVPSLGDVYALDHHSSLNPWPNHVRNMFVYPGTVEGADFRGSGFAMLPSNMDGSVKTTVGSNFNKDYQSKYKIQGKITACDKSLGVRWTIEYHEGRMVLYLPDGSIHIYVDPVHYKRED